MVKYFYATIIAFFLFGLVLLSPTPSLAAYNTVTFDADTTSSLYDISNDLLISSGSVVAGFTVNGSSLSIDMEGNSAITITDSDRYVLTNSENAAVTCTSEYSSITINSGRTQTVTVTPSTSDICGTVAPAGGGSPSSYTPPPVTPPAETTTTTTEATTTDTTTTDTTDTTEVADTTAKPISEMTVTELKAEIVKIAALIAELQIELLNMISSEGGQLTSNLKLGDSNSEVELLQTWLSQDSEVYPEGIVSGWFGPLTKAAVIKFQEKYFDEVLAPWNFTAGTGYVGSTTRAQLNTLYGGE